MQRRLLGVALFAATLVFGTGLGCDGCGSETSIPESADERLEAATQRLPADAQMAFVFSDLGQFRESASKTQSTVDRVYSVERLVESQTGAGFAKDVMGNASFDDVLDESFWKDRGIDPDAAFTLAAVDYNQVVHTYVTDRDKFEKRIGSEDGSDPESIEVAGTSAKKVSGDGGSIVWTIDEGLATVVYPADRMTPSDADSPATRKTLKQILEVEPKESLRQSSAFKKYEQAADGGPTLAYLNLDPILGSSQESAQSPQFRRMAETLQKAVDGGGLVVESEEGRNLLARLWVGLSEKGKNEFDEIFETDNREDWTKFATRNTLFGLRLNVDWHAIWKSFRASRSKQEAAALDKQFERLDERSGIDLREDVFANLSSQAGLIVYGIGGEASLKMFGAPMRALDKVRALFTVKFGSAETLGTIADKVAELNEEHFDLRPLQTDEGEPVESIRVLDVTIPPGGLPELLGSTSEKERSTSKKGNSKGDGSKEASSTPSPVKFYIQDDTLVVAATTIEESEVHEMLTGDAEDSIEGESKLDLGAGFATTEQLTGFYTNVRRFRNIFAKILRVAQKRFGAIKKVVTTVQEFLVSTTPREKGFFLDLEVDLEPPTEGSSSGGE